jgi:hypothetical protein
VNKEVEQESFGEADKESDGRFLLKAAGAPRLDSSPGTCCVHRCLVVSHSPAQPLRVVQTAEETLGHGRSLSSSPKFGPVRIAHTRGLG